LTDSSGVRYVHVRRALARLTWSEPMAGKHEWWQSGIVYQVYPRSFFDTNGDGVGDLRVIRAKLDYLQWLGVDALWLSPIFPSPMADFGYDVSDYTAIHPLFGTMEDFDALLADAHGRGLKVILDFVPNHTSDQHPWFSESRSSRDNPKRNWYVWRDPAREDGGWKMEDGAPSSILHATSSPPPPNNWLSNFGGSAWEFDARTGQYYYHAFLKQQPDLNWRNPELRRAMHDVLRFWLDRGVDGFRVDVIWHIVKDEQFRDNPRNPAYKPGQNPTHEFLATYTSDQPEVHDVIAEMRRVIDSYPGRMMVGEVYLPVEKLVTYYGEGGSGVHMPFNFQLITTPWTASAISKAVQAYEAQLPSYGWPNWVLGNHDNPRIASRIGRAQARVAAMLLLTLRGTPTMYYGDEIAMADVPIPPERVQDPFEKNVPGMGLGRDPERTPMQWDASENAGFAPSGARPWLPVSADHDRYNVANLRENPKSVLSLYRELIKLRQSEAALCTGWFEALPSDPDQPDLFAYIRRDWDTGRQFLIVLNFGAKEQSFRPGKPGISLPSSHIVLSTKLDRIGEELSGSINLVADEGIIVELPPSKS
jgi:alpha-glucosidase